MPKNKRGKRTGNRGSFRQELLQEQLSAKACLLAKGGRGGAKGESGASDDELASEVLSHYSSASESASVLEEGTGGEQVDEQAAQEEMEDKLKQCLDNLMDKSAKTRLTALGSLRQGFSSKLLYDFLLERRMTLVDCLERSLRKGSSEEQAAAATMCALLCVQLSVGSESEEVFRTLRPVLSSVLSDDCSGVAARQSCATALGMCCYVSAADSSEELLKSLSHLESVFTSSYPDCEGDLPALKPGMAGLCCAALQAWALLVSLCPASHRSSLLDTHLPKLQVCLECSSVNYRIAVGETIALLFELGREIDQDFQYDDSDMLCECLKGLATDGNKHRAKNDRRKQRSIFREVLQYIESKDFHEEKIQFGVEVVYIDCWVRKRTYDAFKDVLESGVRHHLQYNQLLRDIFELGPPLVMDASVRASRISRFEKVNPKTVTHLCIAA